MANLLRNFRYSLRTLLRRPAFTIIAVLSLALGIGANTVIFSLINEVFLQPLPIGDPARVMSISTVDERAPGFNQLSHLNWKDLREQNETFAQVAGYSFAPMSVSIGGEPIYVLGQMTSGNYFDALGVSAQHGRTFLPEEDVSPGSHPVAVLGNAFWSNELGGEPGAVGRTITINGTPFTVVGIAPPDFYGLNVGVEPALWIPFMMNRVVQPDPNLNWFETRRGLFLFTFGRLREGVSQDEAQANLTLIAERLEREYPEDNEGRGLSVMPIAEASIFPAARGGIVGASSLLMATVALVLLIACFNVANLLLARATERRKEIALRLALGVNRRQLIGQLLTESVTVGLLGGLLGVVLALGARRLIQAALPGLPFGANIRLDLALDPAVLLFTLGLAVVTGLLFGLLPAIQASKPELVGSLKESGEPMLGASRRFTARNALVVAQIALSLVALLGSSLFLRSLVAAQQIDLGFDSERLFAITHDVGMAGYDQAQGEQFYRDVVERIESLPGVEATALAQGGPLQGTISRSIFLEGRPSDFERTFVQVNVVGPRYFETMRIPLERGRAFEESDRSDSVPVVVVNETMAERMWPGEEVLGQRFHFHGMEPLEVIGVAADIKYNAPGEDPQPYAYLPLGQNYSTTMTLIARAETDPGPALLAAQREIRQMDPLLPLIGVATVPDLVDNALSAPRFAAVFLGIFGVLALILAAIGIYGVMSYAVNRRAREIGIRIALGAEGTSVLGLVLRQGLALAGVGLLLGTVLAFGASRLAASLLFISPNDPISFLSTGAILLVVALIATLVPALRAMGVDPIRVLRAD